MAKNVKSTVKLNMPVLKRLTAAAQVSLAQTAEAIHTNVVQSQVMPRDTGTLQNESTFVYTQDIANGKVELISSTPYVRRLYYHPEYNFHQSPCNEIISILENINDIGVTLPPFLQPIVSNLKSQVEKKAELENIKDEKESEE